MNLTTEQREKVEDLKDAVNAAREVFVTKDPTPEMVFGCVDADAEAVSALKESVRIAREIFSTASPTAEMIFGVYDHVFAEEDVDDEDDDDEDDEDTDED